MKPRHVSPAFLCLLALGGFSLPVLLSGADKPKAPVAPPAPAKAGPPPTHVLYMGADLSVQKDKKYYHVEDVVGSEFMVRINKKEVFVPTRQRTTGLKVDNALKLSGDSVRLDELESGPGYTPANDPRLKFDRESGAAGGAEAVQNLVYGQMFQASFAASLGPSVAGGGPGADQAAASQAEVQAQLAAAQAKLDPSNQMMMQDQYNTGTHADRMQKELGEENYDAMETSFKISSPVELDDVYMVALFTFREREAKPGQESMLIYAKALGTVGPKPQYHRVREGGLPAGFKFLDCKIHIYNHGEEVATNASSKRVELTRDEARQYVLLDYLGSNKDATVAASAVRGSLPRVRRAELSSEQMNRTYYVKVSPAGTLLALYADEACSLQVDDPAMTRLLADVLYKPALVKGKPVEGVARLRLSAI